MTKKELEQKYSKQADDFENMKAGLESEITELKEENTELKKQIEKMKCLLNEIYSEFGFSELVKIRNDLPLEIQEFIKEIKENERT